MNTSIITIDEAQAIQRAKNYHNIVTTLHAQVLREGHDYGVIPGTNKPTLLKPGAERLCSAFGLAPQFDLVNSREDWDTPLFFYQYRCVLTHIDSGKTVGTGIGSANSRESKYRWRWVKPFIAEKMGVDLKSAEKNRYGNVRVENDDVYSQVNTIDKMAQKRALIAAVLIATNASEFFTQDIEDLPYFNDAVDGNLTVIEGGKGKPVSTPKPVELTDSQKLEKLLQDIRQATGLDNVTLTEAAQAVGVESPRDLDEWRQHGNSTGAIAQAVNRAMEEPAGVKVVIHRIDPPKETKGGKPYYPAHFMQGFDQHRVNIFSRSEFGDLIETWPEEGGESIEVGVAVIVAKRGEYWDIKSVVGKEPEIPF